MRMLHLHSDFIEYEPVSKEIKDAEEIISGSKVRFEDLVVTFIAVEQGDDESIAKAAVDEIKKYLDTVGSKKILLYPYAHLSSDLAPPKYAYELLKLTENMAKDMRFDVSRAPFGWTKAFNIKVKGHPLAESAKVLTKPTTTTGIISDEIRGKNDVTISNTAAAAAADDDDDNDKGVTITTNEKIQELKELGIDFGKINKEGKLDRLQKALTMVIVDKSTCLTIELEEDQQQPQADEQQLEEDQQQLEEDEQ
jgi:hypothetical protein